MDSFRDRVAVVTGGDSGIGRALADRAFAHFGAVHVLFYVITHDESLDPLRRRFQRLEQAILDRPR